MLCYVFHLCIASNSLYVASPAPGGQMTWLRVFLRPELLYKGLICQIFHTWKNHNNTFTSLTLLGCLFKMRFMAMTIQLLAILGDN